MSKQLLYAGTSLGVVPVSKISPSNPHRFMLGLLCDAFRMIAVFYH